MRKKLLAVTFERPLPGSMQLWRGDAKTLKFKHDRTLLEQPKIEGDPNHDFGYAWLLPMEGRKEHRHFFLRLCQRMVPMINVLVTPGKVVVHDRLVSELTHRPVQLPWAEEMPVHEDLESQDRVPIRRHLHSLSIRPLVLRMCQGQQAQTGQEEESEALNHSAIVSGV